MKLPKICGGFLNVTQKCNLACKYCFVKQQPLEIDLKTAKDAIDFYAKNSLDELEVPSITFFGGEPLLKYDEIIKPCIEYIRENYGDYQIDITTNGTLLDEEKLIFFKNHDVGILLSIDGDKETQDYNRPYHSGEGSYKDVDVDLYLKYYPQGTFRATLSRDMVKNLYKNYLWGEGKGYTNAAFIINSFDEWTDKDLETLESELQKVADHIIECKKAGKSYMRYHSFEEQDKNIDLIKKVSKDFFRDSGQDHPACGTCGLGANRYGSIGSSGNIYSCQEMTENPECDNFIIGNIYDGMKQDARAKLVQSFNSKNVDSSEKDRCEKCKLNQVCKGGCTINNYFKSGRLDTMDRSVCFYNEKCFELQRKIRGEI